jgi:hypothetical protein
LIAALIIWGINHLTMIPNFHLGDQNYVLVGKDQYKVHGSFKATCSKYQMLNLATSALDACQGFCPSNLAYDSWEYFQI